MRCDVLSQVYTRACALQALARSSTGLKPADHPLAGAGPWQRCVRNARYGCCMVPCMRGICIVYTRKPSARSCADGHVHISILYAYVPLCRVLAAVLVRVGLPEGPTSAEAAASTCAAADHAADPAPTGGSAASYLLSEAATEAAAGVRREVSGDKAWRVLLRWCAGCGCARLAGFALM